MVAWRSCSTKNRGKSGFSSRVGKLAKWAARSSGFIFLHRTLSSPAVRAQKTNDMGNNTTTPELSGAASCSLLVECEEDVQEFRAHKPHNRFSVWKGRDGWHKDLSVQIRLEPSGDVYLSTQEGHVSTLHSATITIEQLHALIRGVTANVQGMAAGADGPLPIAREKP